VTGQEAKKSHYIIRGGVEGRERLRILARIMRPATLSLLQRAGIQPGMACLDVGCGGGDVTFDLARLVGPSGRVVGIDIDEVKIEIARSEAAAQQIGNIEFRVANIGESEPEAEFDFAHVRFVLSHLPNPTAALGKIRQALHPRGILAIADVEFGGYFSDPDCPALRRHVELYVETVKRRGADANIGPRLPRLLLANGFERVQVNVVQHAEMEGEQKLLNALTMEFIADAVLAEGLASRAEIDQIVTELHEFARNPNALGSGPRIFQAWGYRTQV
jgi:ubiquinone/menaquinone biosynthesis C-methylase UbiE